MGSSDGYIAGKTKIVDHGPDSQRYNIVIFGDGYRASELAQFHADVQAFVDTFRATAPYNDLFCGINIHRVDVVSTDSGADDPAACGGTGAAPKTYFDSSFCNSGIQRLLECDSTSAQNVAKAQVPQVHMTMVIVNSAEYGGSGGAVATFSTNAQSVEIGLHEMGHTAFGFADEYEYYSGCGSGETGHDNFSGGEPSQPNVTANSNKNTIKWKALLTSTADSLPTTANADCTKCDPQTNPKAADYVGAYEGADYVHCGCYRPSFTCRMRALSNPFCAVCQDVIRKALAPFLPAETLTLATPSIAFTNIPEGLGGVGVTTYRAVVFEVVTCGTRTFAVTAGPTGGFGTPLGTSVAVTAADADPVAEARLWISYTSTTAGSVSNGTVTVHCNETGQDFVINIMANSVARPKSAVALVLDHSGSMADDAGDGITKVAKLREASNIFINAMLGGDGLSVTRFDDTSQILMPVTDVGGVGTGAGRTTAVGIINGSQLDPAGNTSIGAGAKNGKQTLDDAQAAASPLYDVTAMVVLTDGMENSAPMIADVSSSITANTFAIGLGEPQNISVAALDALTQGHNGYLLITGATTPDQSFRLSKYFLQVLAGVTNAQVVLDPQGDLAAGVVHRIPFNVTECDMGLDVFLLTPNPSLIDFQLETPDGTRLAHGSANVKLFSAGGMACFRLSLPALPADALGTRSGIWNAVLSIRRKGKRADGAATLRYNLIVHSYSNLSMKAHATQSHYEPGAVVSLYAALLEYDVPVQGRAQVWADISRPDGSFASVSMSEIEPGRFEGQFATSLAGVYTLRVRSIGTTFEGNPFQREQALTAVAIRRGDQSSGGGSAVWCQLLRCFSQTAMTPQLTKELEGRGVRISEFLKCLSVVCEKSGDSKMG